MLVPSVLVLNKQVPLKPVAVGVGEAPDGGSGNFSCCLLGVDCNAVVAGTIRQEQAPCTPLTTAAVLVGAARQPVSLFLRRRSAPFAFLATGCRSRSRIVLVLLLLLRRRSRSRALAFHAGPSQWKRRRRCLRVGRRRRRCCGSGCFEDYLLSSRRHSAAAVCLLERGCWLLLQVRTAGFSLGKSRPKTKTQAPKRELTPRRSSTTCFKDNEESL